MKSALQRMLDTEMDVHLGRKEAPALLDPLAAGKATRAALGPPGAGSATAMPTVVGRTGQLASAADRFTECLPRPSCQAGKTWHDGWHDASHRTPETVTNRRRFPTRGLSGWPRRC
jgi:hypothetical protein